MRGTPVVLFILCAACGIPSDARDAFTSEDGAAVRPDARFIGNDGIGELFEPCSTACDCRPGLACLEGSCTLSQADAHYCCESRTCPTGARCQLRSGAVDACYGPDGVPPDLGGRSIDAASDGASNDASPGGHPVDLGMLGTGTGTGAGTTTIGVRALFAHTAQNLYRMNPDTFEIVLVGGFSWSDEWDQMTDIAIDKHGGLFGVGNQGLYAISTSDASCTRVAPLDWHLNALTFLPEGAITGTRGEILVGAGENRLFAIDPQTGVAVELRGYNGPSTSGDVVSVSGFGTMATVVGAGDGDRLERIDPQTGHVTIVGDLGFKDVWGLAYWKGQLFGFTAVGDVIAIDPATAHARLVNHSDVGWSGAAVTTAAPVLR